MQDPLNWLQVGDTALNEFRTEGLASKLFPTLLPFEKRLVQVFNIIQLYRSVQQIKTQRLRKQCVSMQSLTTLALQIGFSVPGFQIL